MNNQIPLDYDNIDLTVLDMIQSLHKMTNDFFVKLASNLDLES